MALNEGLPFASSITYKGEFPLDTRMQFETLYDMNTYPDYQISDGAITFCVEDRKVYVYNKSITTWEELKTGSDVPTLEQVEKLEDCSIIPSATTINQICYVTKRIQEPVYEAGVYKIGRVTTSGTFEYQEQTDYIEMCSNNNCAIILGTPCSSEQDFLDTITDLRSEFPDADEVYCIFYNTQTYQVAQGTTTLTIKKGLQCVNYLTADPVDDWDYDEDAVDWKLKYDTFKNDIDTTWSYRFIYHDEPIVSALYNKDLEGAKENKFAVLSQQSNITAEDGFYKVVQTSASTYDWQKVSPYYSSLKRLDEYVYEITFDKIPEYNSTIQSAYTGACSTFVSGGKMYRNFDYYYNNDITFKVITKDFTGIARLDGLNEIDKLDETKLAQLPYHIADGINKSGIMVSMHVVINDFNYTGSGSRTNDILKVPYEVLTNIKSINDTLILENYLSNAKVPEKLANAGYLVQYLISDGSTTKAFCPTDTGYVSMDITSIPKMTNFVPYGQNPASRSDTDIQQHPTGIERYNLIDTISNDLASIRFTKAYQQPNWLSEFIGENGTDKDSTDAELKAVYDLEHIRFTNRTRNGETWQTCHSVVYDRVKGIEHLWCQENYVKDYVAGSGGGSGGGGGSYNDLSDIPTINTRPLKGNLTGDDLQLQSVSDGNLETTNKAVVGAINEINTKIGTKVDKTSLDGVVEFKFVTSLPAVQEPGILYFIEEG